MQKHRDYWDNGSRDIVIDEATKETSGENVKAFMSLENCRETCLSNSECLQFSYRSGRCALSKVARLGYESHEEIKSEWILQRIEDFQRKHSGCEARWISNSFA